MGQLRSSSPFFRPGPPALPGHADPEILSFLASRVEGEIFDLGGGRGAYAQALRERGHRVTVGERDPECLAALRSAGIPCLDMNTEPWERLAGRFDTVMLVEVLEHVDDPGEFLACALTCARRRLLLTVPCNDSFPELFEHCLTFNHIAVSDHLHQFTSVDITTLLGRSGWRHTVTTGAPLFPGAFLPLLRRALAGNPVGRLALLPLRAVNKLGWLPRLYPSRIFAEAIRPTGAGA